MVGGLIKAGRFSTFRCTPPRCVREMGGEFVFLGCTKKTRFSHAYLQRKRQRSGRRRFHLVTPRPLSSARPGGESQSGLATLHDASQAADAGRRASWAAAAHWRTSPRRDFH